MQQTNETNAAEVKNAANIVDIIQSIGEKTLRRFVSVVEHFVGRKLYSINDVVLSTSDALQSEEKELVHTLGAMVTNALMEMHEVLSNNKPDSDEDLALDYYEILWSLRQNLSHYYFDSLRKAWMDFDDDPDFRSGLDGVSDYLRDALCQFNFLKN